MNIDGMCNLKKIAQEQGIIFFYSGYFSQKVLMAVGDAIKQKMTVEDVDMNTSKKIFSIFVEQVQNIIRYSADRIEESKNEEIHEHELSYGIVVVGKSDENRFYVNCGNVIENKDAEKLKKSLEEIAKMDKEELKKAYKDKLKEGPGEGSKGAGIGFLEMARKASEPIEFAFKDADNCKSFFLLKVFI